ncbi:MAG: helicase associated domain-containing protein [Prevotellaceae bacterium]|nr:helicase associated domain-containing protein [Prevotellaceae bacterium]
MASKNEENWMVNYEALKVYIEEHGYLLDKHKVESRSHLWFARYTRKKIKEGTLDEEKRVLFESLLVGRSVEHTGGRKRKVISKE